MICGLNRKRFTLIDLKSQKMYFSKGVRSGRLYLTCKHKVIPGQEQLCLSSKGKGGSVSIMEKVSKIDGVKRIEKETPHS